MLSRGLRQVKEWIGKATAWADVWCFAMRQCGYNVTFTAKSEEILFSNGSRICGLPANPKTARGYSANLILDEFAYHDHPDRIWAGVFPSVTNEIAFQYKVRIGSTVAGKNNKFWRILEERDSEWSKHVVTVEDAVRDGMPINIPVLRKAVDDEDIWRQEYMCEPVDAATVLLPYELLEKCTSNEASADYFDMDELRDSNRQFFLGMDIGRQHDLSAIWLAENVAGKLVTRRLEVLNRVPLDEQQGRLFDYLRFPSVAFALIDGTGIGYQIAENAEREFPCRAEKYMFNAQSKADLFIGLQGAMQRREFLIPKSATIRNDLHSVQRLFTSGGRVLFSAPTSADGHADRATAAALCQMAFQRSQSASSSAEPINIFSALHESVPTLSRVSLI